MTSIQRQYSLPNCTLFLEGFNDRPKTGFTESRPLITALLTAECRLSNQNVLRGGREFLTSLVRATSVYAQEVLSGVNAPKLLRGELVQLQRGGLNQHQLSVRDQDAGAEAQPQELTLSSAQLFDLIEAVDQLLADPQTLPDLSVQLSPISRRHIQVKHPISEQVVPATIGVTSLAIAAIAMAMIPTPVVQQPLEKLPNSAKTQVNGTPTPTPTPTLITNATQLEEIQNQLFTRIDKSWKEQVPSESVVYRVTVDANSRVLGYLPQGDLAREELEKTPLLNLLRLSKQGGSLYAPEIAQYEVTFNHNGTLDVRPWKTPTTAGALLITPPPTPASSENQRLPVP